METCQRCHNYEKQAQLHELAGIYSALLCMECGNDWFTAWSTQEIGQELYEAHVAEQCLEQVYGQLTVQHVEECGKVAKRLQKQLMELRKDWVRAAIKVHNFARKWVEGGAWND